MGDILQKTWPVLLKTDKVRRNKEGLHCLELLLLLLLLLSRFSRVWLCATPWTAAHQAPPPLGLSRQEHEWVAISFSNAGLPKVKSESEVAQSCPTSSDLFTNVFNYFSDKLFISVSLSLAGFPCTLIWGFFNFFRLLILVNFVYLYEFRWNGYLLQSWRGVLTCEYPHMEHVCP